LTLFPRGLAHLRSDDPEAAAEAFEEARERADIWLPASRF
jgi:hypothetical protein